jgi:hypothetical protein
MAQVIDLGKIRFNWAGTYNAGTQYSYNDLVKYGPNLYAYNAVAAATGVLPTNTGSWVLATEGVAYKGVYTSGTLYYKNDIVTDNTNTYITVTQHTATSSVATSNSNLELIALGQEGIPSQAGNTNKVLVTDGAETEWSATTYLTKNYVGDAQGQDASDFETSAALTNTLSVFSKSAADFVQFPIVNESNGTAASTDFIAYTAQGTNDSGWIDMGITSNNFDATTYGITGPHDGYIFMSAPRTTQFDVVAKSVAGGFATLTTGSAHGFVVGNQVRIEGVGAGFDGAKIVYAVPTATTFRFTTSMTAQTEVELDPFGVTYKPTGDGNLVLATDETGLQNKIVFAAGGFSNGTEQMSITPNENVHIEISTASTSPTTGALTVVGGAGITGNVNTAGNLSVQGTASTTGKVYGGTGAAAFETSATLTDAIAVYNKAGGPSSFAQFAIRNSTASSSTDLIAYMDNGDDAEGWVGMGIAGSAFDDTTYGITGPGDGYIFHNTKPGSGRNGNLVLATGDAGDENKIVFAAGGFADENDVQMVITPPATGVSGNIHVEINTASTSPTTGALTVVGGVGISGDVNIAGDITFGGTGTTLSTTTLSVNDPIIYVGSGNASDAVDLGLVAEYKTGATTKYAGIVRDASDGVIKAFKDAETKPTTTVDFAGAGLAYSDMRVAGLTTTTINSSGLFTASAGITSTGTFTQSGGAVFTGTTDMQELRENVVDVTLSSNTGTLDWTSGNIYYIATAPTAAMTLNVTNVPTDVSKIMTINVFVTQGSTGYIPTTFQIAGSNQTIRWAGGTAPTPTSEAGKIDIFSFTMQRTSGATPGWIVYGSSSLKF